MTTINVRAKGANGEREIAEDLNWIVYKLMKELGYEKPTMSSIQRNQNQSAVGGCDLTGTMGLAIEVKRQENLAIEKWWEQCCQSAERNEETPVLLFRQNGKKWRCIMLAEVELPGSGAGTYAAMKVRAEITYDAFKSFFEQWARRKLLLGYEVKV